VRDIEELQDSLTKFIKESPVYPGAVLLFDMLELWAKEYAGHGYDTKSFAGKVKELRAEYGEGFKWIPPKKV
jgi:hypothetical protein